MIRWRSLIYSSILASCGAAHAVTCITQSQMTDTQRGAYVQAIQTLAGEVQSGNVAAVKAATIAGVAAQFDSIASSIQSIAPSLSGSTLTINSIYGLKAADLKAPEDTQFFCNIPGSQLMVTISIPQLPPGNYALAVVHASGVKQPKQISMILANDPLNSAQWKLAGFFTRPLTMVGHDGLWYWQRAREYAAKQQRWNAYFYFQVAEYLLMPVDFISSPNLEKLQKETAAVKPDVLPGADPMALSSGGQTFEITNFRTDESFGGLDLVVNFKTDTVSDPVAARNRNIDVMKSLLHTHPELREAFHGLWVYAEAPDQRPFAIELPMDQIP